MDQMNWVSRLVNVSSSWACWWPVLIGLWENRRELGISASSKPTWSKQPVHLVSKCLCDFRNISSCISVVWFVSNCFYSFTHNYFILRLHHRSSEIFLNDEHRQIVTLDQDKIKEETIASLKKICQSDVGTNYKLGKTHRDLNLNILAFIN